jgi:hypothetical protein
VPPCVHAFTPYKVVGQHKLVGQFRSAGGLALLGGGKLRPQIFPPLAYLRLARERAWLSHGARSRRACVSEESGGSETPLGRVRPDVLRWPAINRSAAGGCRGDQKVSQTDGVLLDKAEFPQAIMAGGALAGVNDAFPFDVVLQ